MSGIEVSGNTPSKDTDKAEPDRLDFAAFMVRALDDNAEKSVSVLECSRENCQRVIIVGELDQITDMPYPLQEAK